MSRTQKMGLFLAIGLLLWAPTVFASDTRHPAGWDVQVRQRVAADFNPDPDIVEVFLVAYPAYVRVSPHGPRTKVWTYNGSIPGPRIEGKVGDRVIVHFVNLLPEATTIHWHGLEVPAHMDGSNIAQGTIAPGATFRYEFTLLSPATYWYHPHIRSNEQVERGLYGTLIVRDPQEDAQLHLPTHELQLMLDDILLDKRNKVAEAFPQDPLANAETQLNGREGNALLVNGRHTPTVLVRSGVPVRMRLINPSNARFMRISIPGHRLWRVGGDGGLVEHPIAINPIDLIADPDGSGNMISDPNPDVGLLLVPGERADVVFTPRGHASRTVPVEWHDFPRGRHSLFYRPDGTIGLGDAPDDGKRPPVTLMHLRFVGGGKPDAAEYIPPANLRSIPPIDVTGASPIPSVFGHTPPNAAGDVTFFVQMKDGVPLPFAAVTPEDAPTVFIGETRIWQVVNLTGGDHPFHPHGFFFQHLDTQYIDLDNPANNRIEPAGRVENKDTIRLPKRPGAGGGRSRTITRLAMSFDDTGREGELEAFGKIPGDGFSGGWIFHCHILEHADRGMMSFINLLSPQ